MWPHLRSLDGHWLNEIEAPHKLIELIHMFARHVRFELPCFACAGDTRTMCNVELMDLTLGARPVNDQWCWWRPEIAHDDCTFSCDVSAFTSGLIFLRIRSLHSGQMLYPVVVMSVSASNGSSVNPRLHSTQRNNVTLMIVPLSSLALACVCDARDARQTMPLESPRCRSVRSVAVS